MAKQCCVCGRNIGFMDAAIALGADEHYACSKCYSIIENYWTQIWNTESAEQIEEILGKANEAIDDKAQDIRNQQILRDYLRHGADKKIGFINDRERQKVEKDDAMESFVPDEEDTYKLMRSKLMLTTAGTLEGYKVKKQLGVVYGETVFKASAGQELSSAIGDMFRTFSFSAKEMKGQVSIIEEARKFAYCKMMKEALDLGANAIIAIDSDNTIGGMGWYLSLYGTAVYVEPEE